MQTRPYTCCTARPYRAKGESKSRQPPSSEGLLGLTSSVWQVSADGWANCMSKRTLPHHHYHQKLGRTCPAWFDFGAPGANQGRHVKAPGGEAYQIVSSELLSRAYSSHLNADNGRRGEVMGSTRCHWLEGLVVAMHHLNEAGLSQLPSEGSRCTTSADGYALASTSTAVRESNDIAHRLASAFPSSLLVSRRPEDLNKAQPTARRPPRPLQAKSYAHTLTHTIRGHPHPAVYCKVPLPHLFACVRHTRRVPDISIAQGCQLMSEFSSLIATEFARSGSISLVMVICRRRVEARHQSIECTENDRGSSCGHGWDMTIWSQGDNTVV
ncbi:uncharacterized protein B0T23DRAFT_401851 [Neurospora hispaniola]|uniref:Uncharacterized protein n=1 Tax=Neurospora hispaniola TaxID=588809 RepID=A0AAJ0IHS2_9PEZI|nr:hypothetical protein B0T23DRAFT_401851 [Neurospora hispaniola]